MFGELLTFLSQNVKIISATGVLFGLFWTLFTYIREGFYRPRIEFDIECSTFGPQNGAYAVEFTIIAYNKGKIKFTFPEIRLRVLGIHENEALSFWDGNGRRLAFPVKLLSEKVVPPKFKYYFVEPGIRQPITYVTKVPEGIRFIVARASFKYRFKRKLHTREKVFEIAKQ